jgi:hypothetical protein
VPAVTANDGILQAATPTQAVAVSIAGRMEIKLPGDCRLIAGNDVDTACSGA